MFDNDDVCVIEDDYEVIDERDAPDPNKWQAIDQLLNELDAAAGVCWHPATAETEVSQRKPSTEAQMKIVRREIAAWFVQMDGKFIPTQNKDGRLGKLEIEKILPQMLAERFPFDEVVKDNAEQLTFAAIYGNSADPRLSFGVYSGKAYPCPGNPSPRLYRHGLWDINTWHQPLYRSLTPNSEALSSECAFEEMLEFAIPDVAQRTMLLDWIAWNLQNEGSKPNWAIMLYSETKGTGKSTIAKVLSALFGQENTALTNGIRALTQRFSADTLDRKLVVAEEVHISSHSTEGNALKDLITNSVVSVERKYQPVVTIPQTSCFLFMTNHKPLWLEGGERRYYIIDMDHEGHAQGEQQEAFSSLAGEVNNLAGKPQFIRDLYERLMHRQLSTKFDPKNMRFGDNATPIMRELQANSGNEAEQVLEALLRQYNVSIILNEDFPELVGHMRLRNANSLRNMLAGLGWEARRISFGGKQYRAWCKKDLQIEHGRVNDPELALSYNVAAPSNGFTWFDLAFVVNDTWKSLRAERLLKGNNTEQQAFCDLDNSEGQYGPFKGSTTHLRLQARAENELCTDDDADIQSNIHVLRV